MTATLQVRHNIEVAHRLSQLPGKCENIHGHSMWVTLELGGTVDERGLLEGLDFGGVKKAFRAHLDGEFDHRLLLSTTDPIVDDLLGQLPGLRLCPADPTTENLAEWIAHWAMRTFQGAIGYGQVTVNETHVNAATYRWPT